MTGAGGEREHLAVTTCSQGNIRDQSDYVSHIKIFAACRVVTDGPQYVSNGQRPEGGLGHGRHTGVGDVPHGPDVEGEVVTDDGSLHPDIEHRGVRGVLDCVGRIE